MPRKEKKEWRRRRRSRRIKRAHTPTNKQWWMRRNNSEKSSWCISGRERTAKFGGWEFCIHNELGRRKTPKKIDNIFSVISAKEQQLHTERIFMSTDYNFSPSPGRSVCMFADFILFFILILHRASVSRSLLPRWYFVWFRIYSCVSRSAVYVWFSFVLSHLCIC